VKRSTRYPPARLIVGLTDKQMDMLMTAAATLPVDEHLSYSAPPTAWRASTARVTSNLSAAMDGASWPR
jgi:hypothetical protein